MLKKICGFLMFFSLLFESSFAEQNFVLHLPFNEGKGETTVDIIKNRKASIYNATWVEGREECSYLTFNGKESLLVKDDPSLWLEKNFSIEVYIYPEATDCGYVLVKKGSFGFPKFIGNNAHWYIRMNGKDEGNVIRDILKLNEWQHYIMTYDGEEVNVYLNGKLVKVDTLKGSADISSSDILIGNSGGWHTNNFKGKIKFVRIYNKALSEEEVKDRFNKVKEGQYNYEKEIVLEVPFAYQLNTKKSLYFNGKNAYVEILDSPELNPANSFTISAWIKPEKLMPEGYIISKDTSIIAGYSLFNFYGNLYGRIVTENAHYLIKSDSDSVLKTGQWQHVALSWDGNIAQLFYNGSPCGKPMKVEGKLKASSHPFTIGKKADRSGLYFCGEIDEVKVSNASIINYSEKEKVKEVGNEIMKPAVNIDPSKKIGEVSRFIKGCQEKISPLFDFENLEGWKVVYYQEITEGMLFRSQEERLFGDYVGKLIYSAGRFQGKNEVKILPPEPILIPNEFDAVGIWIYGWDRGRWGPKISIEICDSKGKIFSIPLSWQGRISWSSWFIAHRRIENKEISFPAKFISFTLSDIKNIEKRHIYLDNLSFYTTDKKPISVTIPAWSEVNFPTRKETILPSLLAKNYINSLYKKDESYIFSYIGNDCKIEYCYTPKSGTLSDIRVNFNDSLIFQPATGGTVLIFGEKEVSIPGSIILKGEREYLPDDNRISRQLVSAEIINDKLVTQWLWNVEDKSIPFRFCFEIKGKSLIIDMNSSESCIKEFKIGQTLNTPNPKLIDIPFLTLGSGLSNPKILYTNGIFLSAFLDWYNSNASTLYGDSKVVSENSAVYNGGCYYYPKTDGNMNNFSERIFITVSSEFSEVLPNIPNPPSPMKEITAKNLWVTRMWELAKDKDYNYYDKEYNFWRKIKGYGVDNLIIRYHGCQYKHNWPIIKDEVFSLVLEADPDKGGDKTLKEFILKMQNNLGYRVGLYTNYTLLSPFNYKYWDENLVSLFPDGNWQYNWYANCMLKPSKSLELQEYFNTRLEEKFNPNASYADQYTCIPPWKNVDYDERIPGAGKFVTTYRIYGELLQREREYFKGPVLSEGGIHWIYAGLCDSSYAQNSNPNQPTLVDFALLKMHPLCNNTGVNLSWINENLDRNLATQIIYGNTGHLWGKTWAGELSQHANIPELLKSYFMMQQLQQYYAMVPVEEILYNNNGELVSTSQAIINDAYKDSQVYIKYQNGLEVFVNRNQEKDWKLNFKNKTYHLPPNGYIAHLSGKILAYSCLIDGNRVDYIGGNDYIYCDGRGKRTDFNDIIASYSYVMREDANTIWLIPAPFQETETVSLNIAKNAVRIIPFDEDGNELNTPVDYTSSANKVEIKIISGVFKYKIELE